MSNITEYSESIKKYQDSTIPERRWKIVYASKDIFYFTDEEKDFLIESIKNQNEMMQIGPLTFFVKPLIIYPIRELINREYKEIVGEDGKITFKVIEN